MRVKICCIKTPDELKTVARYGIDCVGFVSNMPSGPGIISDKEIRHLAEATPEGVDTFLLTSLTNPEEIIKQQKFCRTKTIQLCNPLEINDLKRLREISGNVKIVGVVHVLGKDSIIKANEMSRYVDAILLDTGNPCENPQKLGGTGRIHDWDISKEICRQVSNPIFLAGGLNYLNVPSAIEKVHPYGVDICCGVRTRDDKLDEEKLKLFLKAIGRIS